MNYFTKEWYSNVEISKTNDEYYEFMKKNLDYYPDWFKSFNALETGQIILHDAFICDVKKDNNDLILNMLGLAHNANREYKLIFKNAKLTTERDFKLCDIIAEELYCSKDKCELQLLLLDDDRPQDPFEASIICDSIDLKYFRESIISKIRLTIADFKIYCSKRNRAIRRNEQYETGDGPVS